MAANPPEGVSSGIQTASSLAGKGILGDQGQCKDWFQKASDQFIPEATYKLAQCHEDGWGCRRDLAEAVRLYHDAGEGEIGIAFASTWTEFVFTVP